MTDVPDHTPDEERWALAVLEHVFTTFPRSKPHEHEAGTAIVTHAAALAAAAVDEHSTREITAALESALVPRWWNDLGLQDAHARLHRLARAMREAMSPSTEPPEAAKALVEAIDHLLIEDLDDARAAGAAADPDHLDEIVRLAAQLPGEVARELLQQLSPPERREQWRRVGGWRDLLRGLGADEQTLDALYQRMSDDSDAARFERLQAVFAGVERSERPSLEETIELVVRLADELGDAGTSFAVQLVMSQASTAPAQVLKAYEDALAVGAVAPPALAEAVAGLTTRQTGEGMGVPASTGLRVAGPETMGTEVLRADVVVIGSGAGGSAAAARLAERGRRVLVLERGPLVDPRRVKRPSELISMVSEAPLPAGDVRVVRNACVGGATLLSNGIASEPSSVVLAAWHVAESGFDADAVLESARDLWTGLKLEAPRRGTRSGWLTSHLQTGRGGAIDPAVAERLSTLHHLLPEAQAAVQPGAFEVLAGCRAEQLATDASNVVAVQCRLGDGKDLRIDAKTVVVAAGAIGSSSLLQASGIGGETAGRGIGFNLTAVILAEFGEERPRAAEATYFEIEHPEVGIEVRPASAEVAVAGLPGYIAEHVLGRSKSKNLAVLSVTAASAATGRSVMPRRVRERSHVDFELAAGDLERLTDGVKLAVSSAFESGAQRVRPATQRQLILGPKDAEDLADLLQGAGGLVLTSNQPQGGNSLSADPANGVVDERLRVHGFDNRYVCDASVFPSATGVYPQVTVMALADAAARTIE